VFDVIKASEGPRRSGIHGEHGRHLESVPDYHALCKVSQVVEDMLRELTIDRLKQVPGVHVVGATSGLPRPAAFLWMAA
jgi:hypothetical protein